MGGALMQLPKSLQPWREWLHGFRPAHLPLLADLLGRIHPILGPLRGLHQGGVPEPDGLGDLQRRGPYERLLASEWLLADALPEEFMRRAVTGEHLFLAPHYRAHQAGRWIVVLFDAGPLQWGAPRLVQLALLILLARRAREAGAQLRWGILQSAPHLHELQSASELKLLLEARTYQPVSEAHWQCWHTWLSEKAYDSGERWVVGQRLPALGPRACTHRVLVQPSIDGRRLIFALEGATPRHLELPAPNERQALELIRGEFEQAAPARVSAPRGQIPRVALTLAPIIAPSGLHIALKLLDEPGLLVIKLPAPRQKKPLDIRRVHWSERGTPLAITFPGRSPGAVISLDGLLTFWNMPHVKALPLPGREQLQMPPGTAALLPVVWLHNGTYGRVFLNDTQGRLAFWVIDNGKLPNPQRAGVTHIMAADVVGMAQVELHTLAYLRHHGGRLYLYRVTPWITTAEGEMIGTAKSVEQVLFAASAGWNKALRGCAWMHSVNGAQHWQLIAPNLKAEQVELAPRWRAIGLLIDEQECFTLVLVSPDQQTVARYDHGAQEVLFTTLSPIARISFCPLNGLICALTKTRELIVYSMKNDRQVLQVLCNHVPPALEGPADAAR